MMQEVSCDDPNGESTFEFVEDKFEGLGLSEHDDAPINSTNATNSTTTTTSTSSPQPTAPPPPPPGAQVFVPAPSALPQFVNYPVGFTTTTPSVQIPLPSTISPVRQFESAPPPPFQQPPQPFQQPPPPFQQPPQPLSMPESAQQSNPYSLAAQRKRPSYPPPVAHNIATPLPIPMPVPVPMPVQAPTDYQPRIVQSQPTAFYAASPPTPSTAVDVTFDLGLPPCQQQQMSMYSGEGDNKGLLSWFREMPGGEFMSKVAEKAKSSVDTMITTLDPQMKEYIHSGGDVNLYVASNDEETVSAVREAFQAVFGRATVRGITSQNPFAPQLVGFSAGMKAADERIQHLRKTLVVDVQQPLVAVDHFIAELTPDRWFDLACLALHDPARALHLHVYSQPTPVPGPAVEMMQAETPSDFSMRWSGLSVTVGSVVSRMYPVPATHWHEAMSGVAKRQITLLAANTLATQYKLGLFNKS